MNAWKTQLRIRYYLLSMSLGGGLFLFEGCGLTDQQWSTVWQSAISSGLNAVVVNSLSGAVGA